jgi:hypothetical protein
MGRVSLRGLGDHYRRVIGRNVYSTLGSVRRRLLGDDHVVTELLELGVAA